MENMIYCRSCGKQIAESAKVCPNCGASNKKPVGCLTVAAISVVIIIFLYLILVTFSTIMFSPTGSELQPVQQETGQENITEGFSIGESVSLDDVTVTLVDVEDSIGGTLISPSEGNVFLLCEFEIENNTKENIAISSMMSFAAYIDGYKAEISLDAMASSDKIQLDGALAAGKKMRGIVGYEVPEDWESIEVHFAPNVWVGRTIIFTYTK